MVACSYCGDGVAMPYRCSLCRERHCGKHRLPEQHDCLNINTFQSPGYSKKRRQKTREIQQIKSGNDPDAGLKMAEMENPILGNIWQANSPIQTVALAGLFLGFISAMELFTAKGFTSIGFSYLGVNIALSVIGLTLVFLFRAQKASDLAISTKFVFWPIGVAIALVLVLLGLVFHFFGFFVNSGGSHKDEAQLSKYSTYTFAGVFVSMQVFYFIFTVLFPELIPQDLVESLNTASDAILWIGLLMMLPFGTFDGAKLYYYNQRSYLMHMGLLVFLIIFTFIF